MVGIFIQYTKRLISVSLYHLSISIFLRGFVIMNLELIAQLVVLALIVVSGPLIIALLASRRGNL
jgi:hypothetical protein